MQPDQWLSYPLLNKKRLSLKLVGKKRSNMLVQNNGNKSSKKSSKCPRLESKPSNPISTTPWKVHHRISVDAFSDGICFGKKKIGRILQFTLGSVLETLEYWLIPADCCGRDPLKRNQEEHDTHKPPFSEIFGTIIKPLTMGWGRTSAQAITHKVPERQISNRRCCIVSSHDGFFCYQ